MATTSYKVLGQVAPSATTETDLYTVPAATQAIVSTIMVANRGTTGATYRITISVAGAATDDKDYIAYDVFINGNAFTSLTLGVTLGATDKIRVYASTADVTFQTFGTEVA
jgi:hypothetical protein